MTSSTPLLPIDVNLDCLLDSDIKSLIELAIKTHFQIPAENARQLKKIMQADKFYIMGDLYNEESRLELTLAATADSTGICWAYLLAAVEVKPSLSLDSQEELAQQLKTQSVNLDNMYTVVQACNQLADQVPPEHSGAVNPTQSLTVSAYSVKICINDESMQPLHTFRLVEKTNGWEWVYRKTHRARDPLFSEGPFDPKALSSNVPGLIERLISLSCQDQLLC